MSIQRQISIAGMKTNAEQLKHVRHVDSSFVNANG